MKSKNFNSIKIEADKKKYYPADMEVEDWFLEEGYVKHTEIDIPLGHSRYGGPVVDLPKGMEHPKNMRFAAQLDLTAIAAFDTENRLPKKGQLYFFADIMTDAGKVIYYDCNNEELQRHIFPHEDNFYSGVLIRKFSANIEKWESRFRELYEDEVQCNSCAEDFRTCDCDEEYAEYKKEELDENGRLYDCFAGADASKLYGIFHHVQWSQENIEEMTFFDKEVLLQIGENGFNDEGVFSVVISKEDLKKHNFDNCEFYWSQT